MNAVPLSEWRSLPTEYPRRYPDGPERDSRIIGDQRLMVALAEECRRRRVTVGELPNEVLCSIVAVVETLEFPSWRLGGDDDKPLRDRIDQHMMPLHEAWALERQAADHEQARRMQENAEFDREAAVRNYERDRAVWNLPAA